MLITKFILLLLTFLSSETIENIQTIYHYSVVNIDGDTISMKNFEGKNILLVNVASKCGYTDQYQELQLLHDKYHSQLAVLGFPSNDFLWQEPGSNAEIKQFCKREYGVEFPMFEKIHVKGKKQHPIYTWLSNSKLNGWNDKSPTWNFWKYFINEKGALIAYYPSNINPTDTAITRHLNIELSSDKIKTSD